MPAGSQRAEAILARTDYVRSRHGAGAIVMATATPVTNSPAEMWVAARLVAPHALADAGLEHFDAMAANFLAPVETVEHGADGKLKVVTRLGEYKNFPDLARMFRSFADVRTTASLGFQLSRARRRQSHRARRRPHPATGDGRRLVRGACRPPPHRRRRRDPRPGHRHLGDRPRRRAAPGHDLRRDVQQVPHPRLPGPRVQLGRTQREADHRRRPDRRDPPPHPRLDLPRLRTARRRPGRVLRRRRPQPRRVTVGVLDPHRPAHRTRRRPQRDRLGPRHRRPEPAPTVVGPGPLRPHPGPDRLDDADGRRGQHPDPALRRPRAHRPLPARLARTSRRPPHPPGQQQHRPSRCTATSPNAPPTPTRGRSCNARPTSSPKRCPTPSR